MLTVSPSACFVCHQLAWTAHWVCKLCSFFYFQMYVSGERRIAGDNEEDRIQAWQFSTGCLNSRGDGVNVPGQRISNVGERLNHRGQVMSSGVGRSRKACFLVMCVFVLVLVVVIVIVFGFIAG